MVLAASLNYGHSALQALLTSVRPVGSHLVRCSAASVVRETPAATPALWRADSAQHTAAPLCSHTIHTSRTTGLMSRRRESIGEGVRVAEELTEEVDEQIERLEDKVGIPHRPPKAAAPTEAKEEASVYYFAFGSNMAKKVFQGRRMIKPAESFPAVLHGYKLVFHQPGLPYREPGFASVEPRSCGANHTSNGTADPDAAVRDSPARLTRARVRQQQQEERGPQANGSAADRPSASSNGGLADQPDVHGVVHRVTPSEWAYILQSEGASDAKSEGHGYSVMEVEVEGYDGRKVLAFTLTTHPKTRARLQGRDALPSKRYITIIREGAQESGLAAEYRAWLDTLQHYEARTLGQKLGSYLFLTAFFLLVPVFVGMRLYRKFRGLQSTSGSPRWLATYFRLLFGAVWWLHERLRPVLGCGCTNSK